jgi:protein-disulfide isomerase
MLPAWLAARCRAYRLRPAVHIVCLAAALGVAGCASLGESFGTSDMATAALPSGATPDVDISATPQPKETFDPFRERSAMAQGGREVMANPTLAEVLQPGPLPEISIGRPDAPVTVIKYMSLTCPYCRQFQATTFPQLKRELIDTGKVRFILREFPIGFQSGLATIALRCAAPDKQFALYEKFLAQQGAWASQDVRPDPIAKVAAQSGVTREQFDACRQDQRLIEGLKAIKERGRTLGIVGTPNFFINNRLIKSVLTIEQLRAAIDGREVNVR